MLEICHTTTQSGMVLMPVKYASTWCWIWCHRTTRLNAESEDGTGLTGIYCQWSKNNLLQAGRGGKMLGRGSWMNFQNYRCLAEIAKVGKKNKNDYLKEESKKENHYWCTGRKYKWKSPLSTGKIHLDYSRRKSSGNPKTSKTKTTDPPVQAFTAWIPTSWSNPLSPTMDGHEHKVIPKKHKNKNMMQEHKHDNNLGLLAKALITRFAWTSAQSAFPSVWGSMLTSKPLCSLHVFHINY